MITSRVTATVVVVAAMAGCKGTFSDIIAVDPADRVAESVLFNDPNQAGLLTNSAQGLFECAYGSYTLALGLLGGEVNSLGATGLYHLDARRPDKAGGFNGIYGTTDCGGVVLAANVGAYVPMSSARWFSDKVLQALQGWTDQQVAGRSLLISKAALYAGFSLTHLGEGFCSMAIDGGPEITPAQVFALAENRFTAAIAAAQTAGGAPGDSIRYAALVGRARVRLNLANNSGALADAQLVPAGFVKVATRGSESGYRGNQIYAGINATVAAGLAPAYFDVRFNGKPDPRVPAIDNGTITGGVARYTQSKYPSDASPIPLATGAEAQLIAAEVQGGQAAVDIITALHAVYGLDPFQSTDATAIRNQIIEERRRQFFLEGGHRNYDRIRYNLPLDPPAGSPYRWGGLHGDAKCLPLPDIERLNNPNTN